MSYQTIEFEIEDQVATIRLNRPQKMNAFTWELGREMGEALHVCDQDDGVRAVVLTGAGKAFCAGADMGGGKQTFGSGAVVEDGPKAPRRPQLRAYQVRKPVIAAINGHAVGVGLTMAMLCDVRFVAEDAKLSFAFVRRGIIPELASHVILPRVVGFSNAANLLLSGRTFRGAEAAELGLATQALPAEDVVPAALEFARDIAVNSAPASVAITKRLLWEGITDSVPDMLAKETPLFAWIGKQPDAAEGVMSFVEKRPPEWKLSPTKDLPAWPEPS